MEMAPEIAASFSELQRSETGDPGNAPDNGLPKWVRFNDLKSSMVSETRC